MLPQFRVVGFLAAADYLYERLLSSCSVIALTAILTPLLVLAGVKNGVVSSLLQTLRNDPRNLEITPEGSGKYDRAWFDSISKVSGVSFVVPQTRSMAAMVRISAGSGLERKVVDTSWLSTATGDPFLANWGINPEPGNSVVLSQRAAEALGVAAGDEVTGLADRIVKGQREYHSIPLRVSAVLPLEAQYKNVAYLALPLLQAVEDYRDGRPFAVAPSLEAATKGRVYASFRLYAASLEDVDHLRLYLSKIGLSVYTRAEEIAVVTNLDRSLSLIIALISLVAGAGFIAFIASNTLAAVRRKDKQLGLLRLMGFSRRAVLLYPVLQSFFTGLAGYIAALILYGVMALIIDQLFSGYGRGSSVCSLGFWQFFFTGVVVLGLCVLSSFNGALHVAHLEPSEVIREI